MTGLSDFRKFTGGLKTAEQIMPVLFIGHGSPMNGIEDNAFSRRWKEMAQQIPLPAAVLVISAHWFTRGTKVAAMEHPPTIHDFGGFPEALFQVQYPAPGHPALAKETASLLRSAGAQLDHDWGLDHGAWTIVRHMYPEADVPVFQLSIDHTKGPQYHYELAKELYPLRKKGVLILGSGNMVHNLRLLSWEMMEGGGYDWALEMNERFKSLILAHRHEDLIHYSSLGKEALLSVPTPEHYLPLLYSLGLRSDKEDLSIFNDQLLGGSLSMTSLKIGGGM